MTKHGHGDQPTETSRRISPSEPGPDELETYHVHDDGTWDWGALCPLCTTERMEPGVGPSFNIRHLQQQNREGWTVAEAERKIVADAAASGREIERV